MTANNAIEKSDGQWKSRTLLAGGLIGAITGMGIAYLLVQRADRQGGEMRLSSGEGLRLGLLVLGMLRQVADLASPDEEE
jgi:hypothetical protein